MTPEHPVRLVLTDDLRRSRLTVFFRLLLVLPHVLWAGLIGTAVAVCVFVNWFVLLVNGRAPDGLHSFVAGYIRYATRVEGYLFLAANPYPGFYLLDESSYPVDLEIGPPERQSRWVTAFRLVLVLPALFLSGAFVGGIGGTGAYRLGYGLTGAAAFLIWWAALFTRRAPRGLRDVTVWGLGYSAQTLAYLLLVTDRYPYSGPDGHVPPLEEELDEPHPVRLAIRDDLRRSRLTVFFRLLLALPHLVWFLLWTALAWLAAIAGWFFALATGRPPGPFVRFLAAYVRYTTHVSAFLLLIGNPFPGFVGSLGSYPIDVALPAGGRQSRWRTLFRLVLIIPAGLLAGGANAVLTVAAFLGWFASLARGRMPEGLRNSGAYALGYAAQVWAFAFLLTDRYPDSTPRRLLPDLGPAPAPVPRPPLVR
jgi:hypothetical protein